SIVADAGDVVTARNTPAGEDGRLWISRPARGGVNRLQQPAQLVGIGLAALPVEHRSEPHDGADVDARALLTVGERGAVSRLRATQLSQLLERDGGLHVRDRREPASELRRPVRGALEDG